MRVPQPTHRRLRPNAAAFAIGACMVFGQVSVAQQAAPPKPASTKPASAKRPAGTAAKPKPETTKAKATPLTREQVQMHWKNRNQELFLNELRLRGLVFEPEESWLMGLPAATSVPAAEVPEMAAAIRRLVPPAPDTDTVVREAPELLKKLKEAAQKRSESEMEPFVHPELLLEKSKVYDLFDTANYRNHSLGKFSPQEYRRVGVQFFQLTTGQVERLHYVLFSTTHGKIVVRDIITGPAVADLFLRDEQKLALSKLELVFRALNDGDDAALKLLCTPGLYSSLKELAGNTKTGGTRISQGLQLSQISTKASVPLDGKSIRVVVRVSYLTRKNRKLEYDIDFERIDNDLKVVRLRDVENRVIAWDPDIDNYLNRRFGLPDGPKTTDVARSDVILQLSLIQGFFMSALEDRNTQKLQEYADEFLDSEPNSGTGYGMRASANYILGNYVEAEKDATLAIQRGGTVYLPVVRHLLWKSQQLWPVVLAISSKKIDYLPPPSQGLPAEEIPLEAIRRLKFESSAPGIPGMRPKPRPFLELNFEQMGTNGKREEKGYNFAAVGTICPGDPQVPSRTKLVQYTGTSICPAVATAQPAPSSSLPSWVPGGNKNVAVTPPMLVPMAWQNDLNVVLRTITVAQTASSGVRPRQ